MTHRVDVSIEGEILRLTLSLAAGLSITGAGVGSRPRSSFKAKTIAPVRGFAVDTECRSVHRRRSFLRYTEHST